MIRLEDDRFGRDTESRPVRPDSTDVPDRARARLPRQAFPSATKTTDRQIPGWEPDGRR
jgi:hypothetical protein